MFGAFVCRPKKINLETSITLFGGAQFPLTSFQRLGKTRCRYRCLSCSLSARRYDVSVSTNFTKLGASPLPNPRSSRLLRLELLDVFDGLSLGLGNNAISDWYVGGAICIQVAAATIAPTPQAAKRSLLRQKTVKRRLKNTRSISAPAPLPGAEIFSDNFIIASHHSIVGRVYFISRLDT